MYWRARPTGRGRPSLPSQGLSRLRPERRSRPWPATGCERTAPAHRPRETRRVVDKGGEGAGGREGAGPQEEADDEQGRRYRWYLHGQRQALRGFHCHVAAPAETSFPSPQAFRSCGASGQCGPLTIDARLSGRTNVLGLAGRNWPTCGRRQYTSGRSRPMFGRFRPNSPLFSQELPGFGRRPKSAQPGFHQFGATCREASARF